MKNFKSIGVCLLLFSFNLSLSASTIGEYLNSLSDRTESVINQNNYQSNQILVKNSNQILLAVTNAKVGLYNQINNDLSTLSPSHKKALTNLEKLLVNFESLIMMEPGMVKSDIKQIISKVTEGTERYKVNAILPGLLESKHLNYGISIELKGEFKQQFSKMNRPFIIADGATIYPLNSSTELLQFKLTSEGLKDLKADGSFAPYKIEVSVPIDFVLPKKGAMDYVKFVHYLVPTPTHAARITFEEFTVTKKTGFERRKSTPYYQTAQYTTSNDYCLTHDEKSGQLIPTSAQIIVTESKGKKGIHYDYKLKPISLGEVCFEVKTYKKGGVHGELDFYIDYQVKASTEFTQPKDKSTSDLEWGKTLYFMTGVNSKWKAFVETYDGQQFEISADQPILDNRIVKVSQYRGRVSISSPTKQVFFK